MKTTSDLTIFCDSLAELSLTTYSTRTFGNMAATLENVNLEAAAKAVIDELGAESVLDEIGKHEIIDYLESLGYVVSEEEY